jgi:hypothetical protein
LPGPESARRRPIGGDVIALKPTQSATEVPRSSFPSQAVGTPVD